MNKLLYIAGGAALGMLVLVNKGLTSWDEIREAFGLSANGVDDDDDGGVTFGGGGTGTTTTGGTNGGQTGGQTGTEQPPTERLPCAEPPCEDMTTTTINGLRYFDL